MGFPSSRPNMAPRPLCKNNRQWDGHTIDLATMVTVYLIRAAPCRPFRFFSSTVPAHTGTKSAARDSAKSSENDHGVSVGLPREKHDTKAAWLWDNTSINLELNRKEVEVVVVQILRPGSRKKSLLTARGRKPKTNQETRGHLLLVVPVGTYSGRVVALVPFVFGVAALLSTEECRIRGVECLGLCTHHVRHYAVRDWGSRGTF
ncbi:hypothetical protein BDP81DRAFT_181723 [Colletotrichum phormii]|uniref:Uncharacterized protein n=1 Tax=Colletotrichum phormii TaxID=359342 RepID=A0AAI9ZWX5_9PEZI|nr:uncharacterized protein BDP81DRAFT_181723 [Colletotrichum phormii]KAK1639691.1 hypothetical protein BDP81DRAFT_181723 [Colletotrichum phormii]